MNNVAFLLVIQENEIRQASGFSKDPCTPSVPDDWPVLVHHGLTKYSYLVLCKHTVVYLIIFREILETWNII